MSAASITPLTNFLESTGYLNGDYSEENAASAWTKYYNEHKKDTYDATKMTGYRYIPQSDDKTILLDYKGHSNKGKVYTVDYDRKTNNYIEDKPIDIKDITGVTDIEMTPVGFVVNASTKSGDSVKLKMPDVGGPRLEWMQQQMFPAIDNIRNGLVKTLSESNTYREYARNPQQAMLLAQALAADAYSRGDLRGYQGYMDDAQIIADELSKYESGIQNLYNEMSNMYRATDAEVTKR